MKREKKRRLFMAVFVENDMFAGFYYTDQGTPINFLNLH
jgi:hypothetical protein